MQTHTRTTSGSRMQLHQRRHVPRNCWNMYSQWLLMESVQPKSYLVRVSELLSSCVKPFQLQILTTEVVTRIGTDVAKMRRIMDKNEDIEILNWLTPVDYGPQQSDYIKRR